MQITPPQNIISITVPPSLRCLPHPYCLHSSSYSSQGTPSCDSCINTDQLIANQLKLPQLCSGSRYWKYSTYVRLRVSHVVFKHDLTHAQKMTSGCCPKQQLTPSPRALVGCVACGCVSLTNSDWQPGNASRNAESVVSCRRN